MFIPKWMVNNILDRLTDQERRIKRLELLTLQASKYKLKCAEAMKTNAENNIADLKENEIGNIKQFSTIEEIINKPIKV